MKDETPRLPFTGMPEPPDTPYKPYVSGSDTSFAAAETLPDERARSLRDQIWRYVWDAEEEGKTDLEIQGELGIEGSTERPRRVELVQAGRVVDSGKRRLTPKGRRLAVVWVAVRKGER